MLCICGSMGLCGELVWAKRTSLYAHGGMGKEDFLVCTWWHGWRGLPHMYMVVWAKGQLENKCEILISLISIMNLPEGLGQIKEDP